MTPTVQDTGNVEAMSQRSAVLSVLVARLEYDGNNADHPAGGNMKVTELRAADAGKKIAVTDQLNREARGTLETVTFAWEPDGESWGQPKHRVRTAILGISGWQIEVDSDAEVELADRNSLALTEAYVKFNGCSVGDNDDEQ